MKIQRKITQILFVLVVAALISLFAFANLPSRVPVAYAGYPAPNTQHSNFGFLPIVTNPK